MSKLQTVLLTIGTGAIAVGLGFNILSSRNHGEEYFFITHDERTHTSQTYLHSFRLQSTGKDTLYCKVGVDFYQNGQKVDELHNEYDIPVMPEKDTGGYIFVADILPEKLFDSNFNYIDKLVLSFSDSSNINKLPSVWKYINPEIIKQYKRDRRNSA